jgi:two-component system probable response regulator PhcQ
MSSTLERQQHAVLFVDDEAKALKYFRLAFGEEFRILTAASAHEAVEILDAKGDEVGVLITDQRMPGHRGVDLLKAVRQARPNIVRLLTTAYSDLEDAIEAVNSGEIYRYITKPWNVDDLRVELSRSMDLYYLRCERDLLLEEKMNAWQRTTRLYRARDLLIAASCLPKLRGALSAVVELIGQGAIEAFSPSPSAEIFGAEPSRSTPTEAEIARSQAICQRVTALLGHHHPQPLFSDTVALAEVIRKGTPPEVRQSALELNIGVADEGTIQCDAALINELVATLIGWVTCGDGGSISVGSTGTKTGAIELVVRSPDCLTPGKSTAEETEVFARLVSVYLIAHHHAGQVALEHDDAGGFSIRVTLPRRPAETTTRLPEDWLESTLARYEGWHD